MAASRTGNTDRGWNDPPMFDYQGAGGGAQSGSPQHTKLNKRVAYPMSPNSPVLPTGTATLLNPKEGPPRLPAVHILPPAANTTTPMPVPLVIPTLSPTSDPHGDSIFQPAIFSPTAASVPGYARQRTTSQSEIKCQGLPELLRELSLDSEDALLAYVQDGLNAVADSVKDTLQGRAMEDVVKKVGLMSEWWTAGKVSLTVKSHMGSLVAALNNQDLEQANEIHLALMINHTTEVNQWLVAVKHLVQELQSRKARSEVKQRRTSSQSELEVEDPATHQKVSVLLPTAPDAEADAGVEADAVVAAPDVNKPVAEELDQTSPDANPEPATEANQCCEESTASKDATVAGTEEGDS